MPDPDRPGSLKTDRQGNIVLSRRVLLEGYIGGLDDDELAASLGTSRANVHVIRHRDLAKLRRVDDYMRRLAAWYRDG